MFRNIQDKLADRKSPDERRFGTSFDVSLIQFEGDYLKIQSLRKPNIVYINVGQRCFQDSSSDTEFWRRLDRRLNHSALARHREPSRVRGSRKKIQGQGSSNQERVYVLAQMFPGDKKAAHNVQPDTSSTTERRGGQAARGEKAAHTQGGGRTDHHPEAETEEGSTTN